MNKQNFNIILKKYIKNEPSAFTFDKKESETDVKILKGILPCFKPDSLSSTVTKTKLFLLVSSKLIDECGALITI